MRQIVRQWIDPVASDRIFSVVPQNNPGNHIPKAPEDVWHPLNEDGSVNLCHINGSHCYVNSSQRRAVGRSLNCFNTAFCLAKTLAGTPMLALPSFRRGIEVEDALTATKQEFGVRGRNRWRVFKSIEEARAHIGSWGPKQHGIIFSQDYHGHCYNVVTDSRGVIHILDPQSGDYSSMARVSMGMKRPKHRVFHCGSYQSELRFIQWSGGDRFEEYLIN
jgi:hypothetical protein